MSLNTALTANHRDGHVTIFRSVFVSEVLSLKIEGLLVVVFNVKGLFSRSWVRFLPIVLGDIGNRKITSTVFCIPELLKNTCDLNGQVLSFLISLNTGSRKEQQEKLEGLYL